VRPAAPGASPPAATGPPTATPAAARVAAGEERSATPGAEAVSQDTIVHRPPSGPEETEPDREFDEDELEAGEAELEAGERERDELHEDEQAEDLYEDDADEQDEDLYEDDPEYDDDFGRSEGVHEEAAQRADLPPPPPPPWTPPPAMPARAGSRPPQGPILPPYAKSRPGGAPPWYRRGIASRGGALAIGAILFVVALLVVGVLGLGGDEPAPREQRAARTGDAGAGAGKRAPRSGVVPGRVTVSVLNGTTAGGLAAKLGDKLEAQGFRLGNVTNSTDQQRAESVVLFAPGAEREAAEVGRRLKIDQREAIDPESQTLAGDASVVVISGTDLTQ
ncbi:MAG: LytR C-terminal domain-containing protein, partial [Actinomycetota bacterium]|nr:LytR C-terminal domain-containing protein [Actinomycetota bacterium]